MRFKGELRDLEISKKVADRWGYGNTIDYLKIKWADSLLESGLDAYAAGLGAFMSKSEAKRYAKSKSLNHADKEDK